MPARSSAEVTAPIAVRTAAEASALTRARRCALVALNFIPTLHIAGVVLAALLSYPNWFWRTGAVCAGIYLAPPLLAGLVRLFVPIREQRIPVGSAPFFAWWTLLQLQMVFLRFPLLEEALRILPGAYSCWLRLWGARIGRLTYWSPGTVILDRPFVEIGDDVLFGAGVRINPHVIVKNERGEMELLLATVKIGTRVFVGGYSTLTAGSEIAADETTHAFLVLPPFSSWVNGRRVKNSGAAWVDPGRDSDQRFEGEGT